jgi:hypothetical protein
MALIVEVLDATDRTVRTRVRADVLPLTIGRAWDNDVIVEDLYVDARHARIHRDEAGNLCVEDLGSLNGLVVTGEDGSGERRARVVAGAGIEVRLGRTLLRFHDPADPVPPSPPDLFASPAFPAHAAAQPTQPSGPGWALLTRPAWRLGTPLAAAAIIALQVWLASYERNIANEVLYGLLAFVVMAALWTGVWALAARVVVGRFHFTGHYAVISAAVAVAVLLHMLGQWVVFAFPGTSLWTFVEGGAYLLLVAAVVAGHLALASRMTPRRQVRAGVATSAVLFAFVLVVGALDDDAFTDVPEFPGVLKPVTVRWPAPLSIDGFLDAVDGARQDADALLEPQS